MDHDQIAEGASLTERALASPRSGAYTPETAIAAVHAEPPTPAATEWRQIGMLYDQLLRIQASPVVELNRAVAVAMCDRADEERPSSMACWIGESSPVIILRTLPARIGAAGWDDSLKRVLRMKGHRPSLRGVVSADSWLVGCGNYDKISPAVDFAVGRRL